jgi:hypothetical protein
MLLLFVNKIFADFKLKQYEHNIHKFGDEAVHVNFSAKNWPGLMYEEYYEFTPIFHRSDHGGPP